MPGVEFLIEFEKIKKDIEEAIDRAHKQNPKMRNKSLIVHHKHELSHTHEVKHKVELTVLTALIAALAFIIALTWHDAIKGTTSYLITVFIPQNSIIHKFFEALLITLVAILGIYLLTRLQHRMTLGK